MPIVFGDFILDESRRQLLKGRESVRLSPKGFQFLSILTHAAPSAVSKADLQEQLWPDTFVTEGSLATLVTEVRSALGDDAREPRFIRTLYGFGYSFAAPLKEANSVAATPAARRVGHLTTAAAFGAIGIVLILASRSSTGSARPPVTVQPIRSIAVLPFDTAGADQSDQHLGLGLPDLVITRLTNVKEIVVRPTSAVREFEGQRSPSAEIGRKLQVDGVVEGSVRTSGDRVRVTVQLLSVRDNKPIWAERFDEKRADIFTIEDSVSTKLAEALRVQLTPDERMLLGKRYTSDPEAYQFYVQARYHMERFGPNPYADDVDRALDFFQKCVQKDPKFAAAWAGMSRAWFNAGWYKHASRQEAFINARNAANRALELDGTLSEPYAPLANIKASQDLDFDGALRLYNRGLELNPRDTSVLLAYAYLLQAIGHFDQAIAISKRLIEVDPVNTNNQWRLANAYLTSGQLDLASKQVQVVLGMDANYAEAHIALVRLAIARGDYDVAIGEAERLSADPKNIRALAFLGYAYARAGRAGEARQILQRLQSINRSSVAHGLEADSQLEAFIYAGLGDTDAMIGQLEKIVEERAALRLKTEPIFLPYHSDPRFIALLHRAGFKD